MKARLPILSLLLILSFSGCSVIAKRDLQLPAISAKSISYDRSGRFTATKIEATNVVDNGETVTADTVSISHDNPWFNARIRVEGYSRQKTPAEKK